MVGEILRLIMICFFIVFVWNICFFEAIEFELNVICLNLNGDKSWKQVWFDLIWFDWWLAQRSWCLFFVLEKFGNTLVLGFQTFSRKKKTTSRVTRDSWPFKNPQKLTNGTEHAFLEKEKLVSKTHQFLGFEVPCFQLQGCIFFGVLERLLKNTQSFQTTTLWLWDIFWPSDLEKNVGHKRRKPQQTRNHMYSLEV